MTTTHTSKGIVWTDLLSPTDDEIAAVVQKYKLHPLVGEELKDSPSSAKMDFFDDYILAVFTLPVREKRGSAYAIVDREIDFVIGKDFLITSRSTAVEQLEYFAKIFDTNAVLSRSERIEHPGHLFYYMILRLYAGMSEDLENIKDSLVAAESRIFKGDERKMVEALSTISRELIDFRQIALAHREIWDSMLQSSEKSVFGAEFLVYARDLRDEFNHVHEVVMNAKELLADLRSTNDSLLNTKQNDIIRTLTIINFIFIPATFIAALFTIPAPFVPLTGNADGWTIILVGMIVVTALIWAVIKRKRWI